MVTERAVLPTTSQARPTMVEQAVQRRLLNRRESALDEVRRMLDAGIELMSVQERPSAPRVADIVARAGTSNDAFYRAFGNREEFLAAIVDDGARRLLSYVGHQQDSATDAESRLRQGFMAILSQAANPSIARTTRAVISCAPARRGSRGMDLVDLASELGTLFEPALTELGSQDALRDARTLAQVCLAEMQRFLWNEQEPGDAELDYLMKLTRRMILALPGPAPRPPAARRRPRASS